MTRINVIPVEELSDQHLVAEYRELPRVFNQYVSTTNAPETYTLGTGHVRWAKKHDRYCVGRFIELVSEMFARGFNPTFTADEKSYNGCTGEDYTPTEEDIALNRARIKERYDAKPDFYRWTNREKPSWLD